MKGQHFHKQEQARRAMRMADLQLAKPDLKSCLDQLNLALKIIKELIGEKNEQKVRNRTGKKENSDAT